MTIKKNITSAKKIAPKKVGKVALGDSWSHVRAFADMLHEPLVFLNKDLRVLTANESFYQKFQMTAEQTEKKLLSNLGQKEWDVKELRELLKRILPKKTCFQGFELTQEFAQIGKKVLLIHAREIQLNHNQNQVEPEQIILLAIQDVTELTNITLSLSTQDLIHRKEITALHKIIRERKAASIELTGFINSLSGFT